MDDVGEHPLRLRFSSVHLLNNSDACSLFWLLTLYQIRGLQIFWFCFCNYLQFQSHNTFATLHIYPSKIREMDSNYFCLIKV